MSGGQDEAAEQIETSGSGRTVQRVVLDEATGRYFAYGSDGRLLRGEYGQPLLFTEPAAAFIALSMEEAAAKLRTSGLPVVDPLALLDQAQATEKKLRQQVDELQSLLSRIRKIICDFGVAREPRECIEAWLQRSLMAANIERLATELAKDGFLPIVSRCRKEPNWHCQLMNSELGFYPSGSGATAADAIEAAAQHHLVREAL